MPMRTREEFWAELNRRKQRGWMNFSDWSRQFGRNVAPYARQREYQNFLATRTRPTATRMPLNVPYDRIRPTPTPMAPFTPQRPTPMGSPGNTGSPISITYKFSDPSRPPAGQTQQAGTQKAAPLMNPLPSRASTGDHDWRAGFQNRQPQNQGGLTNWLTQPATPPSSFGILGRRPLTGRGG